MNRIHHTHGHDGLHSLRFLVAEPATSQVAHRTSVTVEIFQMNGLVATGHRQSAMHSRHACMVEGAV